MAQGQPFFFENDNADVQSLHTLFIDKGNLLLQICKAIVFRDFGRIISESVAIFLALVQVKGNRVK